MAVLESTSLSRKLQALAMVCLMIATTLCFADNNTTVLNAYIRHAVVASQDLNSMIADKAGTVSEQALLAEHFIRGGKHLFVLNDNIKTIETFILNHQNLLVNGDLSKQVSDIQSKLNAMGFKATIHLGDSTDRARSLAAIKKYGLKGLLQHHGSALEQLGVSYVQPYAENRHGEPMLMPAEARLLQVVRPSAECGVMLATT